jgi:8-amino-7-oxononanoate synthase
MSNFKTLNQPLANKITLQNKTYLYFGGTAYLGIPQNNKFKQLFIDGIDKYGINNGTSRNNNVQLGIYNEAEHEAARRFKAENAIIVSSGYLAAQLTVKALVGEGTVIYAPNTHPAIWVGQPRATANTFADWTNETINTINNSEQNEWVLITNSMNNLFPEIYDFSFLKDIDSSNKIILIVDDSHGIGVNNDGLGAFVALPKLNNVENVVVASMAKALGVDAGLVLASNEMITKLKRSNEFVGGSPPAAACLYAFIQAEQIYVNELQKLNKNIAYLSSKLDDKWKYAANFPVYLIDDAKINDSLLEKNILISSFPYPNADSAPLNRIVLCSWHTDSDMEYLLSNL